MPLPKPPAKRAALLNPDDFDSQAAPRSGKRSPKSRATAVAALADAVELYDASAAVLAAPTAPPVAVPAHAPAARANGAAPQGVARTAESTPSTRAPAPQARPRKPRSK